MTEKISCNGCKAKCCRYIATEIDKPEKQKDYEEIIWYLLHKNVQVFIEDNHWYLQFLTDCKELDKDWKCKIYEKRPRICRELDIEACEMYGIDDPNDITFKEPEDFIEYLETKKNIRIKNW